ncbi:MAG: hypothetical protein LBI81_03885 [Puniceicoccales bacterium]|jgi:hypothetical protein|nr:hypothetical protein [Puniceicoccales bacterium]
MFSKFPAIPLPISIPDWVQGLDFVQMPPRASGFGAVDVRTDQRPSSRLFTNRIKSDDYEVKLSFFMFVSERLMKVPWKLYLSFLMKKTAENINNIVSANKLLEDFPAAEYLLVDGTMMLIDSEMA